jgi:hypothetical protein
MKLQIIKIIDRGIPHQERIWFRVLGEIDLSYFIVFDTTYLTPNSISNIQRHAYWFAPKQVKSGDYVILYTGLGTPTESKNNDGSTNHFLYWGIDKTIWNKSGDCAVLFELNSWETSANE